MKIFREADGRWRLEHGKPEDQLMIASYSFWLLLRWYAEALVNRWRDR